LAFRDPFLFNSKTEIILEQNLPALYNILIITSLFIDLIQDHLTFIESQFWLKVIHRKKNLFCSVSHICNLVQEFNGLVSKGVNLSIDPFYI
jgi:hypothetical protein